MNMEMWELNINRGGLYMSNKRAAIRREQKIRDKMNKQASKGNAEAVTKQIFAKGYEQGMAVGLSIIFMSLNELYGFTYTGNGRGRLDKLIEKIRDESSKMSTAPTKFTCEYYLRMLKEQTGLIFNIGDD